MTDVLQSGSRSCKGGNEVIGVDVFLLSYQQQIAVDGLRTRDLVLQRALTMQSIPAVAEVHKAIQRRVIEISLLSMAMPSTVGTRVCTSLRCKRARYLKSPQVRYLRILVFRMDSRSAVEPLISRLFPKSTPRD